MVLFLGVASDDTFHYVGRAEDIVRPSEIFRGVCF
jgi:hypothetical protein